MPVQAPSAWQQWAAETLQLIGAPINQTNLDTLGKWRAKEGTRAQNNPLATTQPWSGASNFNSVGVKNYPTPDVGARATAATLSNGLYPNVITAFQNSVPAAQWSSAARSNLDRWGGRAGYSSFLSGSGGGGGGGGIFGQFAQAQPMSGSSSNPLDAIGSAIGAAEKDALKQFLGFAEMAIGGLMILAGLAIIVLMAYKGSPAAQSAVRKVGSVGRLAASATPQSRIANAAAPAKAPPAKAPPAAKTLPKSEPEEPEYRAGGRVLEMSPQARAALRARQKQEAA